MKLRLLPHACLLAALAAGFLLLSPQGSPAGPSMSAEDEAGGAVTVESKTVGEMIVLAQRRVGPYKRLGPVFSETVRFGHKHGITGPLVGIYHDDARRTPPDTLKADLGIITNAESVQELVEDPAAFNEKLTQCKAGTPQVYELRSHKPYQIVLLPARQVAFTKINWPFQDVPKSYKPISDWAARHGYRIYHPVVEIYDRPPVSESEPLSTEVQINVERSGYTGQ